MRRRNLAGGTLRRILASLVAAGSARCTDSMTSMPTILQLPARRSKPRPFDELSLVRAFASFTEAAWSLERSYIQLQDEVTRLRRELEETNRDLARSLAENQRMRQHLNRILEGLPCGVLVTEADGSVSIANPEMRRLLGTLCGCAARERCEQVPVWLRRTAARMRSRMARRARTSLPQRRAGMDFHPPCAAGRRGRREFDLHPA